MKIIRLILLVTAITLIASKTDSTKTNLSMNKENKNKKDDENPIAGIGVHNDEHVLQRVEVKYLSFLYLL